MANRKVTLITKSSYIVADNGLVSLTISKPQGLLTAIKYGGIDNLLDTKSNESNRGYFDINWSFPGGQNRYNLLRASEYSVINLSKDHLEVSFRNSYDPNIPGRKLPLTVDLRYILRSGVSGFYCYTICERPPKCPAFDLAQARMTFKLERDRFHYMAITDEKQRIMPMAEDIIPPRGEQLIVPESVRLLNPINIDLKGEVDDKYQYSMDNKDGGVHGWISSYNPIVGFWIIFPTQEFRNGGPTKQNLTCHTGPACLADYHFWVQTDTEGNFAIKNVVPGVYGLHGWVPGFIGDYLKAERVTISAGLETQLGNLSYISPRGGPTIWQIGFPDRTANEYNIPDVNPLYVNKLFNSSEKYRQYGLWDRYTDLNPNSDQVFTVGVSDPKKDWFFAHVDRKTAVKYVPSTWEIRFYLKPVASGTYKMRLAIASANRSDLEVHVNQLEDKHLVFQIQNFGQDNAVCRHGIHGLYQLFSVDISSSLLIEGNNSIFLTQARGGDALCGIMYDYIRLEAP